MIYNFGGKLLFKHITVTCFVNELVSIVRRLILSKSKNNIHFIYSFIYSYTNLVQQLTIQTMKINQSSMC